MGETIKQRDYMFDTFRGLLMWSIPISHFTRVAGNFSQDSLGGVIYITINVFVMQAFVFLSGYFSKNPTGRRRLHSTHLCGRIFSESRFSIWSDC